MSIYSTLWDIKIPVYLPEKPCARIPKDGIVKELCHEEWFEVFAQAVPGHIKDYSEWLPPAIDDDDQIRCVVFVELGTKKVGQRYIKPLKVITGNEYSILRMDSIIEMLEYVLEKRHWPKQIRKITKDMDL